jgi:hypothetical protein
VTPPSRSQHLAARLARIGIRSAAIVSALALILGVATLDRVDSRPYFREAYYTESIARIQSQLATNTPSQGELDAGFGEAKLTPSIGASQDDPAQGSFRAVPLAGYGNRRGLPATGVHDDVFVKAVALRVGDRSVVVVGVDALIVPQEVAEAACSRLESELKLPRGQVYLSATHTHASLGAWGEGWVAEAFAGGYQPGARVWFAECIVRAVRAAVEDLQPASLGHGRFDAPDLVRNRLVGSLGRVDPEFSFLMLRQSSGRTAIVGSFSAHATVLSSDMMEFSADYPGFWRRAVERSTRGMAVFLAGGVGSHSPVSGGKGLEGAERMGTALADRLVKLIPGVALTNRITLACVGADLTMPPLNVRISDGVRLRPWVSQRLLRTPGRQWIQVLRLDDALWVSTPCDFSGELALDLKDAFRVRRRHMAITSFNGGYIGYVIPSRYYHMNGYEPRTMSFFGPNVPDYFEEVIRTVAGAVSGSDSPWQSRQMP